ncbi:unnamed protein product [Oppiella nova]|uniref:Uncharacterized protein n=1 Tax=Oppiella nova TaxID=334625 RepID=A0A7R9LQG5_9ACAR|nr:unnamed protein product [Oppiella nova]CAG2165968.1 unnamed protein product [Oppiella nova]
MSLKRLFKWGPLKGSSIHAYITIPGVIAAYASLVWSAGFGYLFYTIASLPHWAIGMCIGCGIGFGVLGIACIGIGIGGDYLYRYYKKQNIKYRTQMLSQWRLEEENRVMRHRLNQLEPGYNVNDVMRINYMDKRIVFDLITDTVLTQEFLTCGPTLWGVIKIAIES